MRKYQKFLIGFSSFFAIGAIVAGTSVGLTNSLNYTISSESNNNAANDLSSWTTTFNNYAKNHYQNLVKTDLNYYCQNANNYLKDNLKAANNLFSFPFYTMYVFSSGSSSSQTGFIYNQTLTGENVSMTNLTFNKNNTSFNVDLNISLTTSVQIYTLASYNSSNPTSQNEEANFTISLDLNDATIAPTVLDQMTNLISQNNHNLTPSGGWYINHIGTLNWTQNQNYYNQTSNAQQTLVNDLSNNNFDYYSLGNTWISSGTQTNLNFNNPSNENYVACPTTGLLNNISYLYSLNFNQAVNGTYFSNIFLDINKASAVSTGGNASYWISDVFNNEISSYDVAINDGKQTSLNQVTNYDVYAINTSGSEISYDVYYNYQNNA